MSYLVKTPLNDAVFSINIPQIKFGLGVSGEVGFEAKRLGMKSVLLVVGKTLKETKLTQDVVSSVEAEGIKVTLLDEVHVEPDDEEIVKAYKQIKDKQFDGFVALGGGSTIDTAKILNLLYTYPADIFEYINKPIGKGSYPPGPLRPLIAIPTTAGTGSEATNVAVLDVKSKRVKTGISNPYLKPSVALVDPLTTLTLPPGVTASTGLDVLNHAIESLTAKPYTSRPAYKNPGERPVYAGSTPVGDLFASAAIQWVHKYLRRAYANPSDVEARYYMMLGASIAGLGFGHAGVHLPHAMAYPIAGMIRKWYPQDYEFGYPIVPHGVSTAIPGAYALKYLTPYAHEKFALVADLLELNYTGNVKELADNIFEYYVKLLQDLGMPTTLKELDFSNDDLQPLVDGTLAQQRLLSLCPKDIKQADLKQVFLEAM
ncbi:alcohol dehydrogenase [Sulfolobales archaeon HS-7]|nr:alcohol dehydrogenase [Sulfolobales archaeon HS-7]